MGLIKSALGAAMNGGNSTQNGFSGPRFPLQRQSNMSPVPDQHRGEYLSPDPRQQYDTRFGRSPSPQPRYSKADEFYSDNAYPQSTDEPPRYSPPSPRSDVYSHNSSRGSLNYDDGPYQRSRQISRSRSGFRPFAVPQIDANDGSPFLRAYSYELQSFGISEQEFIQVIDAINVAEVPNPEMQIFQKGANIAGWFLPGAAGIGLMAGQIAVGVGGAFGHTALINKVLAKSNLEIFLPKGLEICLGKAGDVDNETGVQSYPFQPQSGYPVRPEDRVAAYRGALAPLDEILPVAQGGGRNDPIAMLGRGLANKSNTKKAEKNAERVAKGKRDKSSDSLKWLIVRRATPAATAQWQQVQQQSNQQLQQAQAQSQSQDRY